LEFLNHHKNWSLGGVIAKAIYSTEKSKQQTEIYRIWIIIIEKLIELSKYEDMTLEFIFFNFYLSRINGLFVKAWLVRTNNQRGMNSPPLIKVSLYKNEPIAKIGIWTRCII